MFYSAFPASATRWRSVVCSPHGGYFWGGLLARSRAFSAVALQSFHGIGVDALQKQEKVGSFHLQCFILAVYKPHFRKTKCSDLEALGKNGKAVEVPPENFYEVAASTTEEKERSRKWILMH